jgi:hypothetical protein
MKKDNIRRAVALFRCEYAPRHIRRANARKWLRSIEQLGPRWLLAAPQKPSTFLGA